MSEVVKGRWARRLSLAAIVLAVGGVAAALIAAAGTGTELWHFRTGFQILRYAFYAVIAGGLLAIIAQVAARGSGLKTGRINLAALLIAGAFIAYLATHIVTARSVAAIHDVTTDLANPPAFETLPMRADNLEDIPDDGRKELAALDPEARWKALHREAYGDLRPVRLALSSDAAFDRALDLVRARGWQVAAADRAAGRIEATDTTLFFRFKDDVVIRIAPAGGGSIVDMRSLSRVGGSDVGVNARRIRSFLTDLRSA